MSRHYLRSALQHMSELVSGGQLDKRQTFGPIWNKSAGRESDPERRRSSGWLCQGPVVSSGHRGRIVGALVLYELIGQTACRAVDFAYGQGK